MRLLLLHLDHFDLALQNRALADVLKKLGQICVNLYLWLHARSIIALVHLANQVCVVVAGLHVDLAVAAVAESDGRPHVALDETAQSLHVQFNDFEAILAVLLHEALQQVDCAGLLLKGLVHFYHLQIMRFFQRRLLIAGDNHILRPIRQAHWSA